MELFEDIKAKLDQCGEMATTSVATLEVLPDPQDDRKTMIVELDEFDVIKD